MKRILIVLVLMAALTSAEIRIDSVNLDPNHIEAGDEVTVYVKMHDSLISRDLWSGQTTGYSGKGLVREDPNMFYYAKLVLKDDLGRQHITLIDTSKRIGHLFVGESWTSPIRIKVDGNAPPADYKIDVQIIQRDTDTSKEEIARSYEFTLSVKGVVKFGLSSADTLDLGAVNNLWIAITNEGGGTARHVSLKVKVNESLTTLQSSQVYVGAMTKGMTENITFKVAVDSDAEPGSYNIPVDIEYVNDSGSLIKLNDTIGVRVKGNPKIRVRSDTSGYIRGGLSETVSLTVINEGFVDIKFLDVSVLASADYIIESSDSSYIGTLASDDFDSEDFSLKFLKTGSIPVTVKVTYKDEFSDESYESVEDVNVKVLSAAEYAAVQKTNGGSNMITKLLIIPGLLIAYLVLWFMFKIIGRTTENLNKRFFKRT